MNPNISARAHGSKIAFNRGFTLIEVMVAITITAFVALLAYQGLSAALTAAERNERQVQQLADIQLPLTVLERDIRNAVARPIVDEYGDTVAALSGGVFEDYLLKLTRRGWTNPRNLPRGELQRVRYSLENDQLWRESWSVLDRLTEQDSLRRTLLLDNVNNIELAFLNHRSALAQASPIGGEWVDNWASASQLPTAVMVSIELENFGELRRVFSIPSE